jgi:diguanylate cyclase (GGDEF)-like protein
MVDADHFKHINDTVGHAAGDAVLKALGLLLRSGVRDSDSVVRFGGEEFVLLLDETTAAAAQAKAEALRVAAQNNPVITPNGSRVDFTVSIGIAIYPDDGVNAHVLLSCADQRMLSAKQAGRNRASVVQTKTFRRIETGHLNSQDRIQTFLHTDPQMVVQVPQFQNGLGLTVIGTQDAATTVGGGYRLEQGAQVVAGGAFPQKNIHASGETVQHFLRCGALVIRMDSAHNIRIQVLAADAGAMAVDQLSRPKGNQQFIQHIIGCKDYPRIIHKLSQS